MSADTGVVRGEGKTLHVGRQMAIGEGRLLDAKGRLLAHGTPPAMSFVMEFPEGRLCSASPSLKLRPS